MPKWKKGETRFSVSINDDGNGGKICRIPKPIYDLLQTPSKIVFLIGKKNNIRVDRD